MLEIDYAGFLTRQEGALALLETLSKLLRVDVVYPHLSLCSGPNLQRRWRMTFHFIATTIT